MTLPYQAGDAAGTVVFAKNEPVVRRGMTSVAVAVLMGSMLPPRRLAR